MCTSPSTTRGVPRLRQPDVACGAAMLASKIVTGAKLKVYKGAPHGMCTTLKDQVNEDLLAFIRG